jgi:hypothetical protein
MTCPTFVEIEDLHKDVVNSITRDFPPYCDFQFSNLLSWSSTKYPTKISFLNGNLIVEMKEYDSDRVVTMFMGKHDVANSVHDILKTHPVLERVPEEVASVLINSPDKNSFCVTEDAGNHDYIIRLENIVDLKGRGYKSKRSCVERFQKLYPSHQIREINYSDSKTLSLLEDLFKDVAKEKEIGFEVLAEEFEAVEKLLVHADIFDIDILAVFYSERLVGFTINEILHESPYSTALGCFGKSLRKYKGLFAYMEFVTANYLLKRGLEYINLEEDLGFSGLEKSKSLWRPDKMLKKYIVKLS